MIPPEELASPSIDVSDNIEHETISTTDKSDSEINVSDEEVSVESTAAEKSFGDVPSQEVLAALRQLAKDFETKLKYDASKQELIDKLYKENMEL